MMYHLKRKNRAEKWLIDLQSCHETKQMPTRDMMKVTRQLSLEENNATSWLAIIESRASAVNPPENRRAPNRIDVGRRKQRQPLNHLWVVSLPLMTAGDRQGNRPDPSELPPDLVWIWDVSQPLGRGGCRVQTIWLQQSPPERAENRRKSDDYTRALDALHWFAKPRSWLLALYD